MRRVLLFVISCLCIYSLFAQKFENLAKTPPMGWNSWNKFACDVSEDLIKEIADAMVETGMRDAGYVYLVIDDCWQVARDEDGTIIEDPDRFPSGMKALGDYIHSKGLKFGIYSDAGTATCQGRPGSRGYEFQDARTYAAYGVDYLKYDWCNTGKQNAYSSYQIMRDALYKAGRPIVFSICEWGSNEPWKWAGSIGHLWRTTGDIQDCWDCKFNWGGLGVVQIIDLQVPIRKYNGPDRWNDPDMLEVGNGGLSDNENRAHFSMWCMLSAPLMLGNDLRNMDSKTLKILTNKNMIAIDQDPLGIPAFKFVDFGEQEVWIKPLANDEFAFCFFNRDNESWKVDYPLSHAWLPDPDFDWQKYHIDGNYTVRDLWKDKVIGKSDKDYQGTVPPHDVVVLKLTK